MDFFVGQKVNESSVQVLMICGVWSIGCIDCDQNTFLLRSAFEDQLMVLNDYIFIRTIAQSLTVLAKCNELFDIFGQVIRFWFVKAWP